MSLRPWDFVLVVRGFNPRPHLSTRTLKKGGWRGYPARIPTFWLDPGGLRHLIFAERSPATALGLLLFGFIVTFGSTAMGSAIMAMGRSEAKDDDGHRWPPRLARRGIGRGD